MRLFRGGGSIAAAVLHRGLSASISFLIMVSAGRGMVAADFGSFAVLFATISTLLLLHSAFFSEPMLVYGPRDYLPGQRRYLVLVMAGQFAFGVACAAVMALVALTLGMLHWARAVDLLALAPIVPLALSVDFLERSFFMQLRPFVPCMSALLQLATQAVVLAQKLVPVSPTPPGYLCAYAAGLAAAILLMGAVHAASAARYGTDHVPRGEVAHRHFRYGSWSAVSHIMLFLVTNCYLFLLPLLQNLTVTAVFRAQSAVTGPGAQAFSALGLVAIPLLRTTSGDHAFERELKRFLLIVSLIGAGVLVGGGLFGKQVIDLIYAHKYALRPFGYWLAGAFPMAIGYAFVMGSALRAVDRPDLVAKAAGTTALFSLPLGIALIRWQGAEGVIIAQIIGSLAMASGCLLMLARLRRRHAPTITLAGEVM
jgi:O-antigen/teichoic acid export membrane protein